MMSAAVRRVVLPLATLTLIPAGSCLTAQGTATRPAAPRTGADVLAAMRSAYAGKWYHTLTFVQTTTLRGADGNDVKQTWYETLRHTPATGVQLRIDIGDLSAGNGVIFTADSTFRVRGGQAQPPRASGNEFLPLIEGVYVQPVEHTVKELAQMNVDMSRVHTGTWEGKAAWVVGAASAADSVSPQFWIDADRKVLVRMILRPDQSQPPLDVHLDGYVRAGAGWLATKIEMFQGGVRRQAEEYADWKVDVPVDAALFDVSKWSTAPHWAKAAK
jgi:hypothetical protein